MIYLRLMSKKNNDKNQAQSDSLEVDFGTRKLNTQNFSKTVVLPKTALTGCGCNLDEDIKMNVKLVTKGKEKFIVLTPICGPKEMEEDK